MQSWHGKLLAGLLIYRQMVANRRRYAGMTSPGRGAREARLVLADYIVLPGQVLRRAINSPVQFLKTKPVSSLLHLFCLYCDVGVFYSASAAGDLCILLVINLHWIMARFPTHRWIFLCFAHSVSMCILQWNFFYRSHSRNVKIGPSREVILTAEMFIFMSVWDFVQQENEKQLLWRGSSLVGWILR